MLVLSRKVGESIIIGEGDNQVKMTVIEIKGGRMRVGIEAPKTTPVFRQELLIKDNPAQRDSSNKPYRLPRTRRLRNR